MINSKDVSVVVQGAIDKKITLKCLKSVRKYLPDAEIILSTWERSDVTQLDGLYDKLILNNDPGAYEYGEPSRLNNTSRMLYSTQQGLMFCNRKYILKLRSDLILKNSNILNYSDEYKRCREYKLFTSRIAANNIFTVKYDAHENQKHYRPFHVSDWWFFGLTKDIKLLFDIPLPKEPEFSEYFKINKMPPDKFHIFPSSALRFTPEQYIQILCVKKHFPDIKIEHTLDYNDQNIRQSEIYIVNNYIIMPPKISGIYPAKDFYKRYDYQLDPTVCASIYTEFMWLRDYKKYIDNSYKFNLFKFNPIYRSQYAVLQTKTYKKYLKHRNNLQSIIKDWVKLTFKIILQILSVIFYFFRVFVLRVRKLFSKEKE